MNPPCGNVIPPSPPNVNVLSPPPLLATKDTSPVPLLPFSIVLPLRIKSPTSTSVKPVSVEASVTVDITVVLSLVTATLRLLLPETVLSVSDVMLNVSEPVVPVTVNEEAGVPHDKLPLPSSTRT